MCFHCSTIATSVNVPVGEKETTDISLTSVFVTCAQVVFNPSVCLAHSEGWCRRGKSYCHVGR